MAAMFYSLLIVLIVCAVCVSALKELPAHARGGIAYQHQYGKLYNTHGLKASNASAALIYNSKVDNFDASNAATFAQRYYVDDQYWDGKGPVFFEIGGEGTLSGAPGGYIGYLAKQYSALVVALEHRFYGESIPNGNVNSDNLKYLTVAQALADLSSFTDFYKQTNAATANTPWFVFGGSYPGALSSWYRAAYPEQSVGSLSSSGVVNSIVDYNQFDMQVSAAVGNECGNQIQRINAAFERALRTPKGFSESLSLLGCESDMWKEDFLYMIADSWSMADQYSSKTSLCSAILAPGADASDEELMKTFATFSKAYWGDSFCAGGFCKYFAALFRD
jgi:pimeloyl-ACP methyl ester carboxylesterase